MRIVRHSRSRCFRSPVIALGNFDGLHGGHEAILEKTIELARRTGGQPVVFTFYPHPISVVAPDRAPPQVTSLAERLRGLRRLGAEGVVLQRFTQAFAATPPEVFLRDTLVDQLGASGIVAGYNVTFGKDRRGTPELLRKMAPELGIEVGVVEAIGVGAGQVSSTAIRRALAAGDVKHAGALLGHPHRVFGRVRVGDRRGATIGFPTANILPRGGMLPPDGVYAVRVGIEGEAPLRPAVANLGTNPTFGGVGRRLETHLLEFAGDLYGKSIVVSFVERLRGEVRFASADALVTQIQADAAAARGLLVEAS
ncbi:MAG: bifunctional riboflavin kinase/FAD synthetase [bacterium]